MCNFFVFFPRNSGWLDLPTAINVIASDDTNTLGEALRDLDAKALLRNDFILLEAGVVTNIRLKPLLEKHRATVAQDKGAVMTLVHRKVSPGHRSRSKVANPVVAIDSKTGKIISYQAKVSGRKFPIPLVSFGMKISSK